MKSPRNSLIILIILGLLTIPFSLIPSQIMNYLTGLLQAGEVVAFSKVWPGMVLFFLATVGVACLNIAKTYLSGVVLEFRVQNRISGLFKRILSTNPNFHQQNEPAKISKRIIHETKQVESFWFGLQSQLPLTLIGLLGFAYVLFFGLNQQTPVIGWLLPDNYQQQGNWLLATLIILLAPLQSTLVLFDKKIQSVNRRAMIIDDDVANISLETLSSVAEIRNNFAFNYALARVGKQLDLLRRVEVDITKLRSLFSGLGPILDGLSKVALLALGAWLCLHEIHIPFTDMVVSKIAWSDYLGFAGMALVVNNYVRDLGNTLFQWRMAREAIRRVDEYDNLPQEFVVSENDPVIDGQKDPISFETVTFQSQDGNRILSDLSFNIKPGEHVAFVGPSGCGKSTTMNLLIRELRHSEGSLKFADKPLHDCSFLSLSSEVGQVRQRPILLDESLRDNILLGLAHDLPEDESDLNEKLISVIRKVSLEQDLLKKALDRPLPEKYLASEQETELNQLKHDLQSKLTEEHRALFESFDSNKFLRNATLIENILFGTEKPSAMAQYGDESISPASRFVIKQIKKKSIYDTLLQLGSQLFQYDQNVAMRIHYQAPKLSELLSSLHQAGDDADQIGEALVKANSAKNMSLRKIKKGYQELLISLALDAEVRMVERIGLTEQLEQAIIELRQKLQKEKNALQGIHINSFDQVASTGISIREYLLGGRVRQEIRGSLSTLDELIVTTGDRCADTLVLCGLEAPAGMGGQFLSGGQAMKVAIARIFLKQPSILLLDEATAALDEKSQAQIVDIIRDDFKDKTVISISHRLSTIRDYDRIFVFDRGQVVQEGRFDELVAQEGIFRELVSQEQNDLPELQQSGQAVKSQSDDIQAIDAASIQRAIALSPVFSGMSIDQVMLLERMAEVQSCKEGTVLFERGDNGEELFIILNGEVEFIAPGADGTPEAIDCFGVGKTFGELAVFGNVPRTIGARAKTDLLLCSLSRDNILKLVDIYPTMAVSLLETVAKQVASMRDVTYSGK